MGKANYLDNNLRNLQVNYAYKSGKLQTIPIPCKTSYILNIFKTKEYHVINKMLETNSLAPLQLLLVNSWQDSIL